MSAKDIFQRFFTDDVLKDIVDFTNENYRKKKAAEPGKHKMKWSDLTVPEPVFPEVGKFPHCGEFSQILGKKK